MLTGRKTDTLENGPMLGKDEDGALLGKVEFTCRWRLGSQRPSLVSAECSACTSECLYWEAGDS